MRDLHTTVTSQNTVDMKSITSVFSNQADRRWRGSVDAFFHAEMLHLIFLPLNPLIIGLVIWMGRNGVDPGLLAQASTLGFILRT